MKLDGKTALVTGGASGLGRATAEALLQRGARVIALDRDERVQEVPGVEGVQGSVTEPADVEAAVNVAGALHVVVNAAGVATPGRVLKTDTK
ncbi:MAG: hypothetical protein QOH00_1098, partial [Gaiellales bacterium]|nr:hypothetical protein [Gaiellales bacterium]